MIREESPLESCCIDREGVILRGMVDEEDGAVVLLGTGGAEDEEEAAESFGGGIGRVMKGNFERIGDELAVCGVVEREACCGVVWCWFDDAVSDVFEGREDVEDESED